MGAGGFELGERSEMSIATGRDLWQFGASELAAAIRRRETSSAEVVEAHLRRIASVNPAVNAVVLEMADQARAWVQSSGSVCDKTDPSLRTGETRRSSVTITTDSIPGARARGFAPARR